MSIEEFLGFLARDPEAARLVNEVLDETLCRTESCKHCVETRIDYWYKMWLFGALRDPVRAARDIHECIERWI